MENFKLIENLETARRGRDFLHRLVGDLETTIDAVELLLAVAVKEPDGEKAARMADLAARTAFQASERIAKSHMMAVALSSEDAEGDAEEDDEE